MVTAFIVGFIAFLIGQGLFGSYAGLLLGFLAGGGVLFRALSERIAGLEQQQKQYTALLERITWLEQTRIAETAQAQAGVSAATPTPPPIQTAVESTATSTAGEAPPVSAAAPVITQALPAAEPPRRENQAAPKPADEWTQNTGTPAWASRIGEAIRGFIFGGNPVVRIGMIVLFFGVAFLVKYAAERNVFPIEFRLSAIAAGALGLLATGWKLRERAGHYGLVLQGGGIGVLFLTVYGAAKIYHLIPVGLALPIMVALVALCSLLAIQQNARSLAIFGTAGGFLAPVLASTGSGSHVLLFSYYALLNAGIFGIAWFKAWRILNLLGFVFTFVIAAAWGHQFYQPQHFATTEPFLILFFGFYVAIAVLFAHRQPPQLKGYVDGSLVFGVPIVAFALQRPLVRDFEYGLALSALAIAAVYIVLARTLWKRGGTGMRLLTEAFLALGIVFATLAVPLATDGRWTAAAWALEGAALIWVGIHQQRLLARGAGLLLQLGAGSAFFIATRDPVGTIPLWNGVYLGSLIVALGALFSARQMERHASRITPQERMLILPLLIWGLLWWLGAGLREIHVHIASSETHNAALALLALTALAGEGLSRRLSWPSLRLCMSAYAITLPLALFVMLAAANHPLHGWGWLAWPLAIVTHLHLLRRCETDWPGNVLRLWHPLGLWLSIVLLSAELGWRVRDWVPESSAWRLLAWAIVPGVALSLLLKFAARIAWPVRRFGGDYLVTGLTPVAVGLLLWVLAASTQPGAAQPLSYLPLLNPLGLGQLFALLTVLQWQQWLKANDRLGADDSPWRLLVPILLAGGFIWLNAEIARGVHFLAAVPYTPAALFQSQVFQTLVSIMWTLTALVVMTLAARRVRRDAWVVGAGLLAIVVIKLFLIDLAGIGTVARIVSFLAVGGLMLVIGYFAPIPPGQSTKTEEATA